MKRNVAAAIAAALVSIGIGRRRAMTCRLSVGRVGSIMLAALVSTSCGNNTPSPPPKAASAPAPNPRVVYELREKCGKDAREWFDHNNLEEGAAAAGILMNSDFTNHYNEHLNRCYAVLIETGTMFHSQWPSDKTKQMVMTLDKHLVEVAENKDVGHFFINSTIDKPISCNVGDQTCGSREEWDRLVAPYMSQ